MNLENYFLNTENFVNLAKNKVSLDQLILSNLVFPVDYPDCELHFLLGIGGKEYENFCLEMVTFSERIISGSGFKTS